MKLRKNLLAALMIGVLALFGAACEPQAADVEGDTVTPPPEEPLPEETLPDETLPDETLPEETTPEE